MRKSERELTEREVELQREQVRLEEKLYWARHEGVPKSERDKLEQQWNEVRSEQCKIKNEPWTYKYDRRDDFEFSKKSYVNEKGERIETVTAEGKIHNPDATINWRCDTIYGERREAKVRGSISGGTGDDAGHLIKAQYGADPEGVNAGRVDRHGIDPMTKEPAERLNYGLQNRRMNQSRGWKDVEDASVDLVRPNPKNEQIYPSDGGPYHMKVTSTTSTQFDEGCRERSRTMSITDGKGQPVDLQIKQRRFEGGVWSDTPVWVKVDNYSAANPHTPLSREKQGVEASLKGEDRGELIHADFKNKSWSTTPPRQKGPKMSF